MTDKSCFNCKYFEIRDNFKTDTHEQGFKTTFNKCGWEYLIYTATEKLRWFFSNIYCNNWEENGND